MNLRNTLCAVSTAFLMLFLPQCYSFKGISIDPNVNTFYVAPFELVLVNDEILPPPTLPLTFTEALRDKIRRESRLNYSDVDPDIEFSGNITGYDVSSQAPQENQTTAFSQLNIIVLVEYNKHEKDKDGEEVEPLKKSFQFAVDYSNDDNLINIQDDLIDQINDQLVQEIFTWAFNNW